jgi:glycosyltransferase involved in cell wall biosynthesis
MHVGLVTIGDVVYTLDLANELIKETGVSVTLYMCHAHTIHQLGNLERPIERLYEVGLLDRRCDVRLIQLPRMRDLRSISVFYRLSQAMRDDGLDVAHILIGPDELWLAVLAYLLRDIPVTSTMIVPKPNIGERFPFLFIWAIQKLLTYGSNVIIINGADQVQLVQRLYGLSANRVIHVPLSVRTTAVEWSPRSAPEEPGTILFFGRADPHKGLEYLVRAQPIISRQVPEARILISAHGKELARCRELIQDHSKFEIMEGFVPGDAMAVIFQRASLVALPYLSASTSGVLITAYSHAKPVVATRVGCLPEYIEDGITGFLVPPADIEELAHAIIRLLSDNTLRQNMAKNIRQWLEERQRDIARRTVEAYKMAISLNLQK